MNQADTAWMLISTALVLLMTPALAFFYGGLVRSKNALNTMMMSFISLGFVGVLWAVVGYSLALSPGNNWLGDLSFAGLAGVGLAETGAVVALTIPHALYMAFQGTFAIITAALISGAIVERMNFKAYVVFISLWSLVVYAPLAHWVWGGGWLADMGAWDFAGGTVVHINAGVAALVAAMVIGKRSGFGTATMLPHNVPTVLLGAGLLWFGWFGFNAGSALAASPIAGLAFVTTMFAPADGGRLRHRHRRRPGGGDPGGRLHQPDQRHRARRHRRRAQLLRPDPARPDVTRRFARRGRSARRRRHRGRAAHWRLRRQGAQRVVRRRAVRQPGADRDPGGGRRHGDRLQRRRQLRAAEADWRGDAAAGDERRRGGGHGHRRPRRGGVCPRRRRVAGREVARRFAGAVAGAGARRHLTVAAARAAAVRQTSVRR
jgi:hypothetical protein